MKICVFVLVACLLLGACHSKKRMSRERAAFVSTRPVVPIVRESISDTLLIEEEVVPETARVEKVDRTEGNELKHYCVIVGSFIYEQNALNLRRTLIRQGFLGSSVMRNAEGMYRVSAECAQEHAAAWQEVLRIRSQYPAFRDAWLLETAE